MEDEEMIQEGKPVSQVGQSVSHKRTQRHTTVSLAADVGDAKERTKMQIVNTNHIQ